MSTNLNLKLVLRKMVLKPLHIYILRIARRKPRIVFHLSAIHNYLAGEPEIRLLKNFVDRQRAAVDAGASNGSYTYFLSRLCPQVFAYEPLRESADFLRRIVPDNVTLQEAALSDRAGIANLNVPLYGGVTRGTGAATMTEVTHHSFEVHPIRTVRLDDEQLPPVGFIKIDVEGHELNVLAGAQRLIQRDKPTMLIEVDHRYHLTRSVPDILAEIEAMGYRGEFYYYRKWRPIVEFRLEVHQWDDGTDVFMHDFKRYRNNFLFKSR